MRRIPIMISTSAILLLMLTSCVSPFYGTARVEKGFHMDAGISGFSYLSSENYLSPYYNKAVRGDLEVRYGLNDYFQSNLRAGFGWGFEGKIYRYGHTVEREVGNSPFYDATLTLLSSFPFKSLPIVPAIGAEGGYGLGQLHACPVLLLGIGNPEFLTLGVRLYGLPAGDFFLGIHVSKVDIFMGINAWTLVNPDYKNIYPIATLGLGYDIF